MPSVFFNLRFAPCTVIVPRLVFMAPGRVVAIAYNGIWMEPMKLYSQVGGTITMKTPIDQGDQIYALCVV